MKLLQKIGSFFSSAFFIGMVFTLCFTWVALQYYSEATRDYEDVGALVKLSRRAHQVSVDWRFQARGPRAGSDRVSILTVDEKALQQEGRWPWPRGKIKKIVERLVDGGASVIGFDMIFAEPDKNAGVVALERLASRYKGGTDFQMILKEEIAGSNTDREFAEAVRRYAENLVLGVYFENPYFRYPLGFQEMCAQQIFNSSKLAAAWEGENFEVRLIPIDQVSMSVPAEMPEVWADLLMEHFERIRADETESFVQGQVAKGSSAELTETLKIELADRVRKKQYEYCFRWLAKTSADSYDEDDTPDENYQAYADVWEQVIEEDETLANLSADDGIQLFRNRQLRSQIYTAGRWWYNLPEVTESAVHMAYFNAFQDDDGAVRRSKLLINRGNALIPSMALRTFLVDQKRMLQATINYDAKDPTAKGVSSLTVTDEEGEALWDIPVNEKGELAINYAGPQKMFSYLSTADVLGDSPNVRVQQRLYNEEEKQWQEETLTFSKEEFYKDRIFIFGATATGIYDLRVTPFEKNFPGVETHANIVDNILRKDFLVRHVNEEGWVLLYLLVSGLILSYFIGKLGALPGLFLVSFFLTGIYLIDTYFLFGKNIVIAVIFPIFLTLSLYFVQTIFKYFTEERSKKALKGTFGKYVSPAIVDEILSDPSKIELGGSKEHITVFFSDVRGFTTISEKLDAATLSDLLNSYLTPMTDIIFKNKGTLDKYMGDAIMAFFGAPIPFNDHAKYACRTALENIEKLWQLQKEYQKKGLPMIDVGIGLNTGEMSVGNMGSDTVRNYTVMGDAVNLGSRLEGINKQYGTRIIISEFTQKEVDDDFVTREIDWVRVKGKAEPVRIFELVAEGKTDDKNQEMLNWFNEGFNKYHSMQWNEAIADFSKALDINPADPVSKLYVQRCKDYVTAPPESDWDGVFVMTTK